MLNTILDGGTVYDGTGAEPRRVDIGVENGRIAEIGDLSSAQAERRVSLGGLAVTRAS